MTIKFLMRIIALTFLATLFASACQAPDPQEVEVIDIASNEILNHNSDRQEWYSLIKWSDTCEQSFQFEKESFKFMGNGIRQFQVGEQKYIVFVNCSTGPDFFSEQVYEIEYLPESPAIQQLGLKIVYLDDSGELIDYVEYDTVGILHFEETSLTLTYLYKGGGLPACSHYFEYEYEKGEFILQEARQRKCEDDPSLMPDEWERIY